MGTLSLTDPVNGTTADASLIASNNSAIKTVVNGGIDNTNISSGAAIAGSKIGATYTDYSASLSWTTTGSAPGLGNALVVARYTQVGKIVHYYGLVTFGSTSTFGSGGWSFSLPVNSHMASARGFGITEFFHNGTGAQAMGWVDISSTALSPAFSTTYLGTGANFTATTPWTWATSDFVSWNVTYEAA